MSPLATTVPVFAPALPEIFLAAAVLVLLMVGVFLGDRGTRLVTWLSVLVLLVDLILVWLGPAERTVALNGLYVTDSFASFAKTLILIGSMGALILSLHYNRNERMERFEFPILVLTATIGMLVMVSANDLISLYVGLELQSLSLYVIAAFKRDSARSTEAGLKYFVLGALSSGLLLYGCSLLYGFSGTTSFDGLGKVFATGILDNEVGVIIGLVFLVAGLAFKISAVPFHMWTPDVYEGAPTSVTAFFAVAPKVAAICLLLRTLLEPLGGIDDQWRQLIVVISILSMVLGAVAALNQRNIKRLMAYSTIGHIGYALIGVAAGTEDGVRGVLLYMAIYIVMNLGIFACILALRNRDGMVENLDDMAGMSRTHPGLSLAIAIFLFSLAGVPPLAGFFAKFYVFMAGINAGLYTLAVIGILSSVVAAFYYLRIIKIMYVDAPAGEPLERPMRPELAIVSLIAGVLVLFYVVLPGPLVVEAQSAAHSLVGDKPPSAGAATSRETGGGSHN
ncbi:MAG: NADH-quinone oxidoreductase subunit NuoN [Sneathiellaceae bacterium]